MVRWGQKASLPLRGSSVRVVKSGVRTRKSVTLTGPGLRIQTGASVLSRTVITVRPPVGDARTTPRYRPPMAKPSGDEGYRIERDSMGEVRVPAHAKWGAQTHRAVENFPISGMRKDRSLIAALALIKGAAAAVNGRQKIIDKDVAKAIQAAAAEVAEGHWDDHFPGDV